MALQFLSVLEVSDRRPFVHECALCPRQVEREQLAIEHKPIGPGCTSRFSHIECVVDLIDGTTNTDRDEDKHLCRIDAGLSKYGISLDVLMGWE